MAHIILNPAVVLVRTKDLGGFATVACCSGWLKARWRDQLTAMQEPAQRLAEDAVPALHRVHLLRGSPQLSEEAGDAHIGPSRLALLAMRAADRQRDLPSVARLSRDGLQQQRSAGNRLTPMIRISQAHEQAPPVINQGNAAGEQAAEIGRASCRER